MFHHFGFARLAQAHLNDLQRQSKAQRLERVAYPDRERRPRIQRHWANRF